MIGNSSHMILSFPQPAKPAGTSKFLARIVLCVFQFGIPLLNHLMWQLNHLKYQIMYTNV